jgi:hypothetical protein
MSARQFLISRDQAELLVELIEWNWASARFVDTAGDAMELAVELREEFGMGQQPAIEYGSAKEL